MIKTRIFTAFAAAALIGAGTAPAFAKAQDSQPSASAGGSANKGARKLCRRYEQTGSRVRGETVCLTKAEWKKFDNLN